MLDSKIKFITILGPTASGKTDLALSLAERFNGEIICADSRTIYRGMNIGTAKPTVAEQARVPHHLLDLVDPGEKLGAAEFKRLAEAAIKDISARGKVPLLVGGSGLYIDAVIYDYNFPPEADAKLRAELEAFNDDELRARLVAVDPQALALVDESNRRRLIRAIETAGLGRHRRTTQLSNCLTLGLSLNKEVMQPRIHQRIKKMLAEGFLDEVKTIGETYGWDSEAMSGVGYRAFKGVVLGDKTIAAATADFAHGDMMLVKKQLTWFKRNESIHWLTNPAAAAGLVADFLAN